MNRKRILFGVVINDNGYEMSVTIPSDDADKLLALYQQARETVLQGIDDEDQYLTFDPWFKAQDAELYDRALCAYHEEFSLYLAVVYHEEGEIIDQFLDVESDEFGWCLSDSNDIKFDFFK